MENTQCAVCGMKQIAAECVFFQLPCGFPPKFGPLNEIVMDFVFFRRFGLHFPYGNSAFFPTWLLAWNEAFIFFLGRELDGIYGK